MKKIKTERDSIEEELNLIYKNIDRKYKSAQQVTDRIKEIDHTISSSTLKPQEEKGLIKEIDFLNRSLHYVKRLDELAP